MSRPPRPYLDPPVAGAQPPGKKPIDYLPDEYADFLERERRLAREELGIVSAADEARADRSSEGDFAGTLFEASALLAHVLAAYQDRYASEAFIGAALSPRSLVWHGRRLAYEPDPGLSATGWVRFVIKAGQKGLLPAGFTVSTAPTGERKAQDFELLADLPVDAIRNAIVPAYAVKPIVLGANARVLSIEGTGYDLRPGELVVLETGSSPPSLSAYRVDAAADQENGTTRVTVSSDLPISSDLTGYRLYAKPAAQLRLFGSDASPLIYSETNLRAGQFPASPTATDIGYVDEKYADDRIYLTQALDESVVGQPIVDAAATSLVAHRVATQAAASVTFRVNEQLTVTGPNSTSATIDVKHAITGSVTALQVRNAVGNLVSRGGGQFVIRAAQLCTQWSVIAPVVVEERSSVGAAQPVVLPGIDLGLVPGQAIELAQHADWSGLEVAPEIAEVATILEDRLQNQTNLSWRLLDHDAAPHGWKLGELEIHGNVGRVAHGKTIEEILGGSDGVTPFQRFELKNPRITHVPSASGGVPFLEVRVGGVSWERVRDFYTSGPDSRHFLVQRSEAEKTFVVFGDGRNGAIPAAGKRHVVARYRVGLGRDGNVEPRAVNRIKRSSPILERAENPRRIAGGAEPAGLEDVRTQATRFIATFDRAVSVEDHAALALIYPGIARATAQWSVLSSDVEGVLVVIADSDGLTPAPRDKVEDFLRARRDNAIPLEVIGPTPVDVTIALELEHDPAFETENIKIDVREALMGRGEGTPGLLTFAGRDLGKPLFLSELYEVLERRPGVSFVEVTRLDLGGSPARTLDVVPASAQEWLRLEPHNLTLTVAEGA